jgi:hypothetical protein
VQHRNLELWLGTHGPCKNEAAQPCDNRARRNGRPSKPREEVRDGLCKLGRRWTVGQGSGYGRKGAVTGAMFAAKKKGCQRGVVGHRSRIWSDSKEGGGRGCKPNRQAALRHKQARCTKDTAHRTSIRQTVISTPPHCTEIDPWAPSRPRSHHCWTLAARRRPVKYIRLPVPCEPRHLPLPTLSRHFAGTLHSSLQPPTQHRLALIAKHDSSEHCAPRYACCACPLTPIHAIPLTRHAQPTGPYHTLDP